MERSINDIPDTRLTATDLKNWGHCARITYYENCLPDVRPRTYDMQAGSDAHDAERPLAKRRNLSQYGLPDGERQFNVRLENPAWGLVGIIDELVIHQHIVYPVDYKLSYKVSKSFALQIGAYALLCEAHFGVSVPHGYIFLLDKRQLQSIPITPALRQEVHQALADIRAMIITERIPPPPRALSKCRACEFRRFCNDVP
jgi:CRISPR-associated exonuclease Cas4